MKFRDETGYVLATALGAIILVTAIALASYAVSQRAMEHAISNSDASRAYQIASSALEYEVSRYEHGGAIASETGKTLPSGGKYDLTATTDGSDLTVKCLAKVGSETEAVSVSYTVFDLSETIYSGAGGNMFTAAAFNSPSSMVIGALYLKLPQGSSVNSSPRFVDGPLYVENAKLVPKGGVTWTNTVDYDAYHIYADVMPNITASNVVVSKLEQHLSPPNITAEFESKMMAAAQAEGHYYTDTTGTGFNIGGASSPIPSTGGVLTGSGTIFVDGTAIIDSSVQSYTGNWTIFATQGIIARGKLVPSDYATNPSAPQAGSYDEYYSSLMAGDGVELPKARPDYCITLITPGTINSTWTGRGNSSTPFAFCGAMFAGGSINFQESLRGSIIAASSLAPDKKTIIATQRDLRSSLSTISQELFTRTMSKGNWVRSKN